MRNPNKNIFRWCQAALEWSKLTRFNLNDKEFLSATDTLVILCDSYLMEHIKVELLKLSFSCQKHVLLKKND